MKTRAFALLPALWLIVMIGSFVMAEAAPSVDAIRASQNRLLLSMAEWARNACVSRLRSQLAATQRDTLEYALRAAHLPERSLRVPKTDLGLDLHCSASFVDRGSLLNVNRVDSAMLACVLHDDTSVLRILERRPFPNDESLALVLEEARKDSLVGHLLSTRGPNHFNLNSAPVELLKCLDGIGPHGAMVITLSRTRDRAFTSVAEFLDQLPKAMRDHNEALTDRLTVIPPEGAIIVDGYAGTPPIRARMTFTVRLRGTDLDVLHIEEE